MEIRWSMDGHWDGTKLIVLVLFMKQTAIKIIYNSQISFELNFGIILIRIRVDICQTSKLILILDGKIDLQIRIWKLKTYFKCNVHIDALSTGLVDFEQFLRNLQQGDNAPTEKVQLLEPIARSHFNSHSNNRRDYEYPHRYASPPLILYPQILFKD